MKMAELIVIPNDGLKSTPNDNIIDNSDDVSIIDLMKILEISIAEGAEEQAIASVKQLTKLKILVSIEEKKVNPNERVSSLSIRLRGGSVKDKDPIITHPDEIQPCDQTCPSQNNSSNGIDIIDLESGISELSSIEMVVDEEIITDPIITIEDDELNELQNEPEIYCDENIIILDPDDYDGDEIIERKRSKKMNKKSCDEYDRLKGLEDCELIPNFVEFECPICLVEQEEMSGIVLRNCLHSFCRECIKQTVLMANDVEIKCPYRDDDYSCKSTLRNCEIKALLNPIEYEQYLAKSITQAENHAGNQAFHCQTPNCHGWCMHDNDVYSFLCPVCDKVNCMSCKAIHEAQSCDDYQISKDPNAQVERSRQRLDEMVRSGEAMYCPHCTIVITKVDGCDGFQCKCGTDICWATRQARWGPMGHGDTSGGCRCGVNGRKCHPHCQNCH